MFLNILTSIDIFYIVFAIAVFFGFLRGFKKSIYNFIVMAIFYIVFFVTINTIVEMIWTMELSFLGNAFKSIDPSLANFSSFENDYQALIQALFNNAFDFSQPEMDALAIGLIQFVIKISWAIAYFTVILVLYKLITNLIRLIFVRNKKGEKKRLFGAIVGALNGAMAVFVMLIVFGGMVSFVESVQLFLPAEEPATQNNLSFETRNTILEIDRSLIINDSLNQMNQTDETPMIPQETIDSMNDFIETYEKNIFVKIANLIEVSSSYDKDIKVPLHLNLFDSVLSIDYNDKTIALRHEVSMFSKAYYVITQSAYGETNQVTDIKGEDIRNVFVYLEKSSILPIVLPIAIKYMSEQNEIQLSITDEELYDYDYKAEISRLANIMAGLFDIINDQDTSIDVDGNEVVIDGDWVKDIFEDVSKSRVVLLATEVFLVPIFNSEDSNLGKLISIPENLSWESEYVAIGNIIAEMIDSDLSVSTLESGDLNVLLTTLSSINVSVILDSEIISGALIQVLSGAAEIEGIEFLTVPSNIQWRTEGANTGELEYLLLAIQSLLVEMENLDFEDIDVDLIIDLPSTTIDALLNSYIMRATISDQINALELGDIGLTVPNDVLDSQSYFIKSEIVSIIESVKVIYDDLDSFSLDTLYDMSQADLSVLLDSIIIRATITSQVTSLELGSQVLIVPDNVFETDDYILKVELMNFISSIKIIANDIESFDITNLFNLTSGDQDTLLSSSIIQATISDIILEDAVLSPNPSQLVLVIPAIYRENILVNNVSIEQIEINELKAIINGLNAMGITSFDGGLNAGLLSNSLDYGVILQSGSLHLSISNMIKSNNNLDIPALAYEMIYGFSNVIKATEIESFIQAVNAFSNTSNVSDINFTFNDILALSPQDRDVILNSMIVRNMITEDAETAASNHPTFDFLATDYEDNNMTLFLTKAGIIRLIDALS